MLRQSRFGQQCPELKKAKKFHLQIDFPTLTEKWRFATETHLILNVSEHIMAELRACFALYILCLKYWGTLHSKTSQFLKHNGKN